MTFERIEIGPDVVLYRGDCREVLPTLGKVDCVITDPPYGVEGGKGGDSEKYGKAFYGDGVVDNEETIRSVVIPTIAHCVALGVPMAVTPGIRWLQEYPRAKDMGCFWTPAACTHGPWGLTTFQPILFYGKDWRQGKCPLPSGRQVTERSESNGHPCPKPIGAWCWLLNKVAPENALVLDPFMGSGTTGVAALRHGCKFIGIELEPKYFDIARRRIEAEVAQRKLFA